MSVTETLSFQVGASDASDRVLYWWQRIPYPIILLNPTVVEVLTGFVNFVLTSKRCYRRTQNDRFYCPKTLLLLQQQTNTSKISQGFPLEIY